MTLQQMRYFIAVAQNLSFSKAAQQHYVSQTAVSQQIKLLEEELETELFQRTRHSVALTSAGQVFYEYAVRITDLASGEVAEQRSSPRTAKAVKAAKAMPVGWRQRPLMRRGVPRPAHRNRCHAERIRAAQSLAWRALWAHR